MIILKIVPQDPYALPDEVTFRRVVNHIVKAFPRCEIAEGLSDLPQFVDCGDDLEGVVCPLCGAEIDSDDWSILMDASYDEEGFTSLKITTPCCHKPSTLSDLEYQAPCAFSCFEVDVAEPKKIPPTLLKDLEAIAGFPFQTIVAEYKD
ncbi:MAG: hypothetical protein IIY00_03735 [Clostridia bacterium]|nr:hypothetical protein [Clostridia bacterium]